MRNSRFRPVLMYFFHPLSLAPGRGRDVPLPCGGFSVPDPGNPTVNYGDSGPDGLLSRSTGAVAAEHDLAVFELAQRRAGLFCLIHQRTTHAPKVEEKRRSRAGNVQLGSVLLPRFFPHRITVEHMHKGDVTYMRTVTLGGLDRADRYLIPLKTAKIAWISSARSVTGALLLILKFHRHVRRDIP